MKKPETLADSLIPLSEPNADMPRYLQLFRDFQTAIVDGRLTPDTKLPATRSLAKHLGISRNTVKTAYEMLQAEGYTNAKSGSGSYVASDLPLSTSRQKPESRKTGATPPLSKRFQQLKENKLKRAKPGGLLTPGKPCLESFPWKQWQQQMSQSSRQIRHDPRLDTQGHPALRQAIAKHLNLNRGMHCDEKQIIICSGSQQAIYLALSLILDPDDQVLMEDPGYEGVDGALMLHDLRKVAVPSDQQGFLLDQGVSLAPKAKAAIVTPSRNFPLGYTLSLERRLQLLEWAQTYQRWIIEDDYDSDFRFDGPPLTALHGLDQQQCVLYTGTFSRVVHPSIRLGYLVVPETLAKVFKQAKNFMDGGTSLTPQVALAGFIESGQFDSHLRRMRKLYFERRNGLNVWMERLLGDRATRINSDGGLHSVYLINEPPGDVALVERANKHGLGIRALSSFYTNDPQQGLVIGYASDTQEDIERGVRILREIWE